MEIDQTVIYVAGSMQQAHMLRNLLAEHGIQAAVINEALEKGSGVDFMAWATSARVVVHERDAVEARRIAMEHDGEGARIAEQQHPEEETDAEPQAMPAEWPRCPACGSPRITRCPICKTTGIEFPEADDEYVWGMGLDEVPEAKASCGCSGGSCGGGGATSADHAAEPAVQEDADDGEHHLVLMCPMCSDPFLPEFPCQCAWCDHEFPDGYEQEDIVPPPVQADSRVIVIVVGLLLVLAVIVGYFMFVV